MKTRNLESTVVKQKKRFNSAGEIQKGRALACLSLVFSYSRPFALSWLIHSFWLPVKRDFRFAPIGSFGYRRTTYE